MYQPVRSLVKALHAFWIWSKRAWAILARLPKRVSLSLLRLFTKILSPVFTRRRSKQGLGSEQSENEISVNDSLQPSTKENLENTILNFSAQPVAATGDVAEASLTQSGGHDLEKGAPQTEEPTTPDWPRPTTPLVLEKSRINKARIINFTKINDEKYIRDGLKLIDHRQQVDKHVDKTSDWVFFTHPEGNLYFRRKSIIKTKGKDITLNTFTEDYLLSNEKVRQACDTFIRNLEVKIQHSELYKKDNMDFDAYIGAGSHADNSGSYYLVNHQTRIVFWLDKVDLNETSLSCGVPIQSEVHLLNILEFFYWTHIRHFPTDEVFKDKEIFNNLSTVLLYGCCDTQGTSESNYPFDSASMKDLFDIFQNIKGFHKYWRDEEQGNTDSLPHTLPAVEEQIAIESSANERVGDFSREHGNLHIAATIAQYMVYFTKQKVFSRFGEENARVSHLQRFSNKGQRKRFSFVRSIVSFLLLAAPEVYYGDLQRTYDDRLTMEDWKPFFEGVRSDWQTIVINSAVLLNANIAFLAIPNPSNPSSSDGTTTTSPTSATSSSEHSQAFIDITSQVSMILSLSSIIVGLCLLKQSGSARARSERALYHFIDQFNSVRAGLYASAVRYSVPYVLLMYSTLAFVLALTALAVTSQIHTVVYVFLAAGGVILILGAWAVFGTIEVKVIHGACRYIGLWK